MVTLKDRIKKHFEESEWQHKFTWCDGKQYGDKYETIKTLSRILNCPYTSLYIPVKQLKDEAFIGFSEGLIFYERELMPNDIQHKSATQGTVPIDMSLVNKKNLKYVESRHGR